MIKVTNKELELGKHIVESIGISKVAVALTNYNIVTNNIDKRMFLYSDDEIRIQTSGKILFGELVKQSLKFSYNPQFPLPFIVGCNNESSRKKVKQDIKNVLANNPDVLKLSNNYTSLTKNFESVLVYVIKNKIMQGSNLPTNIQLKYDWTLDPSKIIGGEPMEKEIAVTIEKGDDKLMDKRDVMKYAHKLRKQYEAEDSIFAATAYRDRMSFALKEAWELFKDKSIITTEKEVAITTEKEVANVGQTSAEDEITVDETGDIELNVTIHDNGLKRTEGLLYLKSSPGFIRIEDHTGKEYKSFDFRSKPHGVTGRKTYGEVGVKFSERLFARSKGYKKIAHKLVVITSNKSEFTDTMMPKAFIIIKK